MPTTVIIKVASTGKLVMVGGHFYGNSDLEKVLQRLCRPISMKKYHEKRRCLAWFFKKFVGK
ncbi:hypothetical protein [Anaerotignum neopropionicum]|uniref:hypothetical protein n=1 Tax=Anaerotignum neopropionicum TaxID=36847 RepID=UPI0008241B94|nr:hypothetical protein [Anaerotignum neopropionicum]